MTNDFHLHLDQQSQGGCDDPAFDSYVMEAIQEVGPPPYDLFFGQPFGLNIMGMNCRQWAKKVLDVAKANYQTHEKCPNCNKKV